MTKVTLTPLTNLSNGSAVTAINTNYDRITTAIENTLSRDGTTPNQMNADIDLNSNDLLNVDNASVNTLFISGVRSTPQSLVNTSNFATASQGVKADTAIQPNGLPFINVQNYGVYPGAVNSTLATSNTLALKAIINNLQISGAYRGGRIFFPRGNGNVYPFNDEIVFTEDATEQLHNMFVEGEGMESVVLDFSLCSAGKDGLRFGKGAGCGVKDITIRSAPRYNLSFIGGAQGSSDYCSDVVVERVRIQGAGLDGLYGQNLFNATFKDCWSILNTGAGANMVGFCTTLNFDRFRAESNTSIGIHVVGAISVNFTTCSMDRNLYGIYLEAVTCVSIRGCYAEQNQRDAIYLKASTIPAIGGTALEVNGANLISIDTFYALDNSLATPNTFANFLSAEGVSGQEITITNLAGVKSSLAAGQTISMVLNGTNGPIYIHKGLNRGLDGTGQTVTAGTVNNV